LREGGEGTLWASPRQAYDANTMDIKQDGSPPGKGKELGYREVA
jgi:hypothetical protein